MTNRTAELFDEFAARFSRGDNPDVREYLRRAGAGADELAALIDVFLSRSEPPSPTEEEVALVRAWREGEPPLLELRKRRRLTVDQVVEALVGALGVAEPKRAKVKRYYQQLEGGLLEPRGVDRRVWTALRETLSAAVEEISTLRPRPATAQGAFLRADSPGEVFALRSVSAAPLAEERDEVDELFTGAQ